MRRLLLVSVTAVAAAVLASGSWSGSYTGQTRVGCGLRTVTLLFWPQGHPAIPSVNFPEFLPPHLEIYRTGPGYPGANQYGYLGSDGKFSLRPTCKAVPAPLIRARIQPAKTERAATALVCTLRKAAQFDAVSLPGGTRLLVIVPPKTIAAVASIRPASSTLTYSSQLCKPTPPPS